MSLLNEIARINDEFSGTIGVAVRHLATCETIGFNERTPFPTASTIKVPIVLEAFNQLEAGLHVRTERQALVDSEKQSGTGVLVDFDAGLQPTFMDLVRMMIIVSDNTATNMLIDVLGLERVNALLQRYGVNDTRLLRRITFELEDGRIPDIGLGTPYDFAVLMEKLACRTVLSASSCNEIIAILRRQSYRDYLPRYLPSTSWVANKPGMLPGVRNDVGIVGAENDPEYVIAVMTCDSADQRWVVDNEGAVAIARISRLIYDHFAMYLQAEAGRKRTSAVPCRVSWKTASTF